MTKTEQRVRKAIDLAYTDGKEAAVEQILLLLKKSPIKPQKSS